MSVSIKHVFTSEQEKIVAALNKLEVGTFILCDNRVFKKVKAEKGLSVGTVLEDDYVLSGSDYPLSYLLLSLIKQSFVPVVLEEKKLL